MSLSGYLTASFGEVAGCTGGNFRADTMTTGHDKARTFHFHLNTAEPPHTAFRVVGNRVLRLEEVRDLLQCLLQADFGIGEEGFGAGFDREAVKNDRGIVDVV